jgi:hypothetical protein
MSGDAGVERSVKRTQRDQNRADRLIKALATKSEEQELLFASTALILCGLPYAPTTERTIVREAFTASGRVRVTFQAMLEDVPLAFGKDAVLLTFLTTKALLTRSPTVTFATAKEYLDLFGEDLGGKSYKLLAERWRRLAGLVIGIERHGHVSHDTALQVVIKQAHLPTRSSLMAARAGFEILPGVQPHYSINLGRDFWSDLQRTAVPLLLPVMRAFANRPMAWHFVQFLHWRSYVSQRAADHGRTPQARIDWGELRMTLGSNAKNDKQLRRELKRVIADLKVLWPACDAVFDGSTLCVGPPKDGRMLVRPKIRLPLDQ